MCHTRTVRGCQNYPFNPFGIQRQVLSDYLTKCLSHGGE